MFVRVSTFEGPPEDIDEDIAYSKANILPTARKMAGWRGVISLADRGSGKQLTLTFWESEAAMRASEEEANRLRAMAPEGSDQAVRSVERYEAIVYEVNAE